MRMAGLAKMMVGVEDVVAEGVEFDDERRAVVIDAHDDAQLVEHLAANLALPALAGVASRARGRDEVLDEVAKGSK